MYDGGTILFNPVQQIYITEDYNDACRLSFSAPWTSTRNFKRLPTRRTLISAIFGQRMRSHCSKSYQCRGKTAAAMVYIYIIRTV